MKSVLAVLVSLTLSFGCSHLSTTSNRDIKAVTIITSDIDLFWMAFDEFMTSGDHTVFQTQYFDKGSKGLTDFVDSRIKSSEELAAQIKASPQYYLSIRKNTLEIKNTVGQIRSDFKKLTEIYPEAVLPDVYFVIGRLNSGGTTSGNGLLIGAEMVSRDDSSNLNGLTPWHQKVLKNSSGIPGLVAHELIHFQQKDNNFFSYILGQTVLDRCLHEGMADFIGELISGKNINSDVAYKWAIPREKELWEQFQTEMDGSDFSNWLYNGTLKDRPTDVGYFMGYKICEAYYNQAPDRKKAIYDMLNQTDAKQFLEKSGYAKKFGQK